DDHRLFVHLPHEDLLLHADLRSRQADAVVAGVERVEHVVDQPGNLASDVGHGGRRSFQNGIAVGSNRIRHTGKATDAAMSSDHYFSAKPGVASEPITFRVALPDGSLELTTDRGVFSHGSLDLGTRVLLLKAPTLPSAGNLLDLGCGAGAIAIAMAKRSPRSTVWAVDVNQRA